MSVQELLKRAKSYGTTLSVYLTAVYLCAIGKDMSERQKRKPVALIIPVNLRNFFPRIRCGIFLDGLILVIIFPSRAIDWRM